MTFPETLKKAEKTLSELYSECIQAAGDEVLRGTNDWTNLQQTKLIPSSVVASFLEAARKEVLLGLSAYMDYSDARVIFDAVFGGEGK